MFRGVLKAGACLDNGRMRLSRLCRSCRSWAAAVVAGGALLAVPAQALTFQFDFLAGTSTQVQQGFIAAGNLWSSTLNDPVTIRLTVGLGTLASGTIATTNTGQVLYNYSTVSSALAADATSASDQTAVAHLPVGGVPMRINHTTTNSGGVYFDLGGSDNNNFIQMSTANAAALGLPVSRFIVAGCQVACDGSIVFSNTLSFDFDRSNGIASGQLDFVGVAAHEIGHALGFLSGVDFLDTTAGLAENSYTVVSPLDLFRFSSFSAAQGAIDFTASTDTKYLSIDGGLTGTGVTLATGVKFGDGRQASHFKDGLGLGIMDPTASGGELLAISNNDKLAFDVIGWNLTTAVPEPGSSTMWAAGAAVLGIGWMRRRRRD